MKTRRSDSMSLKTIDVVCRVVVDTTLESSIYDTADAIGEAFLAKFQFGSYQVAGVRDGAWYLWTVGDDTDAYVWNPYTEVTA